MVTFAAKILKIKRKKLSTSFLQKIQISTIKAFSIPCSNISSFKNLTGELLKKLRTLSTITSNINSEDEFSTPFHPF
jgi:hypothetical protein